MRLLYLYISIFLVLTTFLDGYDGHRERRRGENRGKMKEHFMKKRMGKNRDRHLKMIEPQVLEFIKKDSAFYQDMLRLKEIDRHLYQTTIRKVDRLDNMNFNEVDDIEELFNLSKIVVKQRVVIEDYLDNRLEKDEVKRMVSQLLNREFDLKESLRKKWIEKMEKRIVKQRLLIEERGKKRDQIIEYRLDEILDGNFKDNEW